jgi:hypothetical protein
LGGAGGDGRGVGRMCCCDDLLDRGALLFGGGGGGVVDLADDLVGGFDVLGDLGFDRADDGGGGVGFGSRTDDQ